MQPIRYDGPFRSTTGIIRDVDVAGRELTVFVYGNAQVFDVPTECSILLHDEPVKLRLLLPGDYAQIAYHRAVDRLVACSIRVNWWLPLTEERWELREARAAAMPARTAGDSRDPGRPAKAGAGTKSRGT
jgi:hypothetical protein